MTFYSSCSAIPLKKHGFCIHLDNLSFREKAHIANGA